MFTYSVVATKRLQASRGWGKSEFWEKNMKKVALVGNGIEKNLT